MEHTDDDVVDLASKKKAAAKPVLKEKYHVFNHYVLVYACSAGT